MRHHSFVFASALSFVAIACSHVPQLKPEPAAPRAPGNPNVAFAEVSGVRVFVAGDAWKGDPPNLPKVFTPIQVTIENQSGHPLRVSYEDFKLVGQSGFAYAAIPPMQAKGVVSASAGPSPRAAVAPVGFQPGGLVVVPAATRIYHQHFFVAPYFSWYYPGWPAWPYAFPYDPFYYDRMYAYWPERLPTQDMLSNALPAGVLNNGGRIFGFLYFQGIADRESRVSFEEQLVDASSGQPFGRVSLPFEVQK